MKSIIDLKVFKIYLPDGDRRSFYIYGDFRELFGVKYQYDAAKKIRKIIKELNLKSQPNISYEENSIGITTKSPEILFNLVREISGFFISADTLAFSDKEWDDLHNKLISWKAPKTQKWKIGDVFSLKLTDDSYVFGQILGDYPTVALFDFKSNSEQISMTDLANKKIVTILHLTSNSLNNWTWKVIGNSTLFADKDHGPTNSDKIRIGHQSFGSNVLESICNYYWFGICKWVNENDLKDLIMIR